VADAQLVSFPLSKFPLRRPRVGGATTGRLDAKAQRQFSLPADCTGDGNLDFLAGADFRYGREGRDETGESLAPEKGDRQVLGDVILTEQDIRQQRQFPDARLVLRAAVVTVHSVTPAEKPNRSLADEDEEADPEMFDSPDEAEEYQREMAEERREQEEADSRRRWFLLDVTITPQEVTGEGFTHWEPGELAIVSPGSQPTKTFGPDDEEEAIGEVLDVSIWHPERQKAY